MQQEGPSDVSGRHRSLGRCLPSLASGYAGSLFLRVSRWSSGSNQHGRSNAQAGGPSPSYHGGRRSVPIVSWRPAVHHVQAVSPRRLRTPTPDLTHTVAWGGPLFFLYCTSSVKVKVSVLLSLKCCPLFPYALYVYFFFIFLHPLYLIPFSCLHHLYLIFLPSPFVLDLFVFLLRYDYSIPLLIGVWTWLSSS